VKRMAFVSVAVALLVASGSAADTEKMAINRENCLRHIDDIAANRVDSDEREDLLRCLMAGAVVDSDLDAATARHR
jgi:hypothetical protein